MQTDDKVDRTSEKRVCSICGALLACPDRRLLQLEDPNVEHDKDGDEAESKGEPPHPVQLLQRLRFRELALGCNAKRR